MLDMTKNMLNRLGKEILIFDGGMGTQLQAAGLKPGGIPEGLNIDNPGLIQDVHERYLRAGADFITTNTFGCNPLKMAGASYPWDKMLRAAIDNAKKAREKVDSHESYIALDIGPIGQMLKPLGTLSFDEAYETIAEQVRCAGDDVDLILMETMTDLYEVKAGILAVKENTSLPVFVTMTFEAGGRTLTGTDPVTFVNVAEGLGADAIGVNCSLGPDELAPIVGSILENAHVPVMVQPNAGLPKFAGGNTIYELTPDRFSDSVKQFALSGVSVCGGCCGTTPDFIRALKEKLPVNTVPVNNPHITRVSSQSRTVTFDGHVIVCGERLNPTGKKKLQAALREDRLDELVKEAIRQDEAGADVLDVNVGLPGIDEAEMMKRVIPMLQEVTDLPLQIDSSSAPAIETACRYYNGKPLINSVNARDDILDSVLPIVKKYGGVVIGLTLEEGIPLLASERVALAEKIIKKAEEYGIPRGDVIIDCLTLTASAQQKEVKETLTALTEMRKRGNHTVLGVSNVSFGLPNRPLLNRTFLTLAIQAGLDLPIMNPLDTGMMSCIDAVNVLYNVDENAERYVEKHMNDAVGPAAGAVPDAAGKATPAPAAGEKMDLSYMIRKGIKDDITDEVRKELGEKDAMVLINDTIIPALDRVGKDYDSGKIYLPQLIQSAEAAKLAFSVVQETFSQASDEKLGPVIICTVEGDIHDIGKNIVKVVCESYGFEMIDLGKDVKAEEVVKACDKYHPKAVGLSALMTTTVVGMKKTIEALHEAGYNCPIFVGGAVLTQEIADEIGADYYACDAMASVHLLEKLLK